MQSRYNSSAFNARWLSYEEVAKTFVPVLHYRQLLHDGHSVLLGPRGCGKTTLLKMLTSRAYKSWEASGRADRFPMKVSKPDYTAVYIPSDVRWSYEIANIGITCPNTEANLAQRVMVSVHVVLCILETLQAESGSDRHLDSKLSATLITKWNLEDTLASIVDVRSKLLGVVSELRGVLNRNERFRLDNVLSSLNSAFYGHILDAPLWLIQVASMLTETNQKWALCFDELEIAPQWLRDELLEALRSAEQRVYLKLTWTPILPSGLKTSPESNADYRAIRLWHSRVSEPREFCEHLTVDFLRERFPDSQISPDDFFSSSLLAIEAEEEAPESYDQGGQIYESFKELASWDVSFRKAMNDRGIDPNHPQPKNSEEKDQFFRKVKPIVILRLAHLSPKGGRSRKSPTLYAGKEAIYSISEGNPRWLRGLLSDFADRSTHSVKKPTDAIFVDTKLQANILSNAGRRFKALIQASPFRVSGTGSASTAPQSKSLIALIDCIGGYFKRGLYEEEFPIDPPGSFKVPEGVDPSIHSILDQLLELGAIVYIGSATEEIPVRIVGGRFRLSFLLAPLFNLPLRSYRQISLSQIFEKGIYAKDQLDFDLE